MTSIVSRPYSPNITDALVRTGIHPLLARLYAARGITEVRHLDYGFANLLDPQSLKGIDKAAEMLANAIAEGQHMVIVADYDCDGATSCAVGIRGLKALGANVSYIVPNRFEYAYGLTPEIVELAVQRKAELIITVDNGISSIEAVATASAHGIRTLITDHHLPGEVLPAADCIVNPNQPGCGFLSKSIAGVGVIFYVLLATRAELRKRGMFSTQPEPNLASLLDLVALGTVADVVKLDQNNRTLVSQGLTRIRQGKMQPGLHALFRVSGRTPERATSADLGFAIGPRLNAAGRLSDMSLGIECLITDDLARALNIANQLDQLNRERRVIETGMQEQAQAFLSTISSTDQASLTLFDPSWHQGVIGILASRVKDKLHRPVIAFARGNEGEIKGSGRSIRGLNLRDAIDRVDKKAPGMILRFGGHAAAAGLTMREKDFMQFSSLFEESVQSLISPADLARTVETDGPLEAGYISLEIARMLENEVWGQGFPAPLFSDEFIVEHQKILKEKHLKLKLRKGNARFDAIYFNFHAAPSATIHAAFRLTINEYNGIQTPQLMIEYFE